MGNIAFIKGWHSMGFILHNAHYMRAFQVLIPRETELGTFCSFIYFLRKKIEKKVLF